MRRSPSLAASLAFGLVISVLGAASTPARATTIAHVFRFATAEEVATLNPDLNQQLVVQWLDEMTSAFLFRLDANNRMMPELATEIPTLQNGGISRDGRTITVHLRKGVKWSDGVPFDAADVAFSIAAVNNSANSIVDRAGLELIDHVTEPNASTIVVHLRQKFGAIVYSLFTSNQNNTILPKHILGNLPDMNNAPFNALPVGIGPFRYKVWKRGDQIELEANPNYWRGRPALSEVILKLVPDRNTVLLQLTTNDIDMWYPFGGAFLARVQAIAGVHILRHPAYVTNEILLNTTQEPLTDPVVRVALRDAANRVELHDKVAHGVGILQNVLLPTVDPLVPKDIRFTPLDVAAANRALDRDGWKLGPDGVRTKNGKRLTIDFASSQGTPDVDTSVELLRSDWKAIGAEMNVQRYQSSILFGPYQAGGIEATGKFGGIFLGNAISAPFDMTNSFGCNHAQPIGQNYNRYCNPKLEPLLAAYQKTYDESTRAKLLSQILHVLDADAISIVVTGREDMFGLRDAVKNFAPNNATPFDDMMRVDVVP